MTTFDLGSNDQGRRADKVLARRAPDWPFAKIQKLFRKQRVRLNGRVIAADARLPGVGELCITAPEQSTPARLLPNRRIRLKVLHRDPHIIVIDKPSGLVVAPGPGHGSDTLAAALLGLDPNRATVFGPNEEHGLVHRLDRDTSGVIIVASNTKARTDLIQAFKRRDVTKVYHALVVGVPKESSGIIDRPVRPPYPGQPRAACDPEGLEARTRWRVLESGQGWSLLELEPDTGRTHQIRVHLAAIGLPVLGDPLYNPDQPPGAQRTMLHALSIGLVHPGNGDRMSWSAPVPRDLNRRLRRARSRRPSTP